MPRYRIIRNLNGWWKYSVQAKYTWWPFWVRKYQTDYILNAEEAISVLKNKVVKEL